MVPIKTGLRCLAKEARVLFTEHHISRGVRHPEHIVSPSCNNLCSLFFCVIHLPEQRVKLGGSLKNLSLFPLLSVPPSPSIPPTPISCAPTASCFSLVTMSELRTNVTMSNLVLLLCRWFVLNPVVFGVLDIQAQEEVNKALSKLWYVGFLILTLDTYEELKYGSDLGCERKFFGLSSCKLGVAVYREGETEWCEFGET